MIDLTPKYALIPMSESIISGNEGLIEKVGGTDGLGGRLANTIVDSIDEDGNVITDLISASIDTQAKTILDAFTFGVSGALQIGTYVNGVSGDIRISPNGIVARNSAGANTITIDGTTGSATFTGDVTGSTITGGLLRTATGTGQRVVIDSADNTITFYNASNAVVAQLGGGTQIGNALRVTLDANTTTGVRVDAGTANQIGFTFNCNANVDVTGLNIQLTGATNTSTGININHDGSSGEGVYVDVSAGARGVEISNSGGGASIYITGSGTTSGASIYISHAGDSSKGIEILYTGRTNAVYIESTDADNDAAALYVTGTTGSQSSGNYIAHFLRTNPGIAVGITTSQNNSSNLIGLEFNIANAGSGKEYAMSFAGSEVISAAVGGNQNKKIRIMIGGADYYIPCYDA